ncbi:hypothetical protein HZH66_014886 [Vespula vulgaris]|uniref:Uncharacterized protein n=1 Tax=Vespula vulgaris TaxID=7454 RepID=A0A834MNI7_VESVU|nr:hypothetical protein HZH66_014886 [Vespula vulgaris]
MKFHSATLTECFVKAKYERRAPKGVLYQTLPRTTRKAKPCNDESTLLRKPQTGLDETWNALRTTLEGVILTTNVAAAAAAAAPAAPSSSSPLDVSGDQLTLPNRTSQKAISIYPPM